ncbi:SDR family NAD(P)-dependent oxidoreductase [Rhodococcus sp. BP-252]|uniref:SDR family NAD(P)-dependent oxidoreductase n=2 Tax=Rhodococcus TaxID=1827 RepID=UPI001C9A6268|nr:MULTISPECIES: SDR family NAD(P)-dependent oxidoreductase [unclassified Rhodococcus (in: high G+C Gram-positive bacteria)]MBY6414516.1 SDR family NAD(P)-dependent oxidoreductase [Rhodococcus sp. BP-320]MBY6419575.1 SDR family NAD(P)-dependent oxidoreductase [Rhodococcus sp. BP-321]MBY6424183.1 SDR family NAD(P)-dependent oxidoreductase [Rhodococcus sp. BP-324]MBY6429518.1 SDR family NAD(P)-dependent oxidoreductase [Rhodococcus sp. BP-323]MBY6434417.1 SDR family NAD(P)-dependent oxidoreductas
MTSWTASDIPSQQGRTAVVTGANSGLGFETAQALASNGAHVVMAVRNLDKGREALGRITSAYPAASLSLQQLDLSSLASVRTAAAKLRSDHDRIDLLVNNAGIMMTPYGTTADGFELQFGTNHLGHFALTGLLMDRILAAPGSRIVTVSSVGHRFVRGIRFDDLQWERDYTRTGAYGQAKLANLMFTYALQRRLRGTDTSAVAAHPGGSNTDLARNLPFPLRILTNLTAPLLAQPADRAALPSLRAATDPGVLGGQFYGPDGFLGQRGYPTVVTSTQASYDLEAQQRLWDVSEKLTDVEFGRLSV